MSNSHIPTSTTTKEQLKNVPFRIKALIQTRGKTHRDIAKLAGTTPASISQIINGKKRAGLNLLMRIALALDTDMNYLCGFERDIDMKAVYRHKIKQIKEILED